MKTKKSPKKYRLGELKRFNRDFEKERKNSSGYENWMIGNIPIMKEQHRCDYWIRRLREKLIITEF